MVKRSDVCVENGKYVTNKTRIWTRNLEKNNENNLTFENKRCILKINSINGRWIKMFNLEELSLEFVEISELKTSKNLFGPVMYGTGVRM